MMFKNKKYPPPSLSLPIRETKKFNLIVNEAIIPENGMQNYLKKIKTTPIPNIK